MTFATDICDAADRAYVNNARAAQRDYERKTEPLSASAIEYAETKVLEDLESTVEYLSQCDDDRKPCAYFGPISTASLVGQVLLNKSANDAQLAAAARELRARILAHHDKTVLRFANDAMGV